MTDNDPRTGRAEDAAVGPAGSTDLAAAAGGDHRALVGAVDALEGVSTAPVHTHAARYHEVHTLLQDALSSADHPGP